MSLYGDAIVIMGDMIVSHHELLCDFRPLAHLYASKLLYFDCSMAASHLQGSSHEKRLQPKVEN